ncbi:MAG: NAD(+) diphosphatase [Hyphomicrobiales bacterium]|nr:NAD(+) diphosphatase [Hyphomicrobiales bacterium]MCP5370593.1 NAD(+) diphosphatase [Hyphomicrobiales bacterium]
MDRHLHYTADPLDRAGHRRADPQWLADRLHDRATRVVPVWRYRNLLMSDGHGAEAVFITGAHARGLLQIAGEVVFLGLDPDDDTAYFAADLSDNDEQVLSPLLGRAEWRDLREVGPILEADEASILAQARGFLFWHRNHKFCGTCGGPTDSRQGGHVRACAAADCGRQHFPRTDPAVIMLVTRPGPDGGACLLGRQAAWPRGMMSTLAGFVEPGETLEQAVAREVAEESGIRVDLASVSYRASQPWPFPSSLMLGYRATAVSVDIDDTIDELEEARWFTRNQLPHMEEMGYRLPRPDSIARWLIEEWMAEGGD